MVDHLKTTQELFADLDIDEPDSPTYSIKKETLLDVAPWTRKYSKSLNPSINPSLNQSKRNLNQTLVHLTKSDNKFLKPQDKSLNLSITQSFMTRRRSRYLQATHSKPLKSVPPADKQKVRAKTISQLLDLNKSVTPLIPSLSSFKRQIKNNSNLLSFWYKRKSYTENDVPERNKILVRGKKLKQMKRHTVPSKSFKIEL